mgnify:CR=1 FL=1
MKKYFIQKAPFVVPTTDGKLIEEHHGLATTNNSAIAPAIKTARTKPKIRETMVPEAMITELLATDFSAIAAPA